MRICDLIKDQETYQAELGHTVLETVRAMVERNIGAVPVIHCGKLVGIFSERDLMRRHGFRHLPVCHEGHLLGIVSLRDILLHDLNEKDDEMRMMRAYIHSMPDA